MTEAKTTAVWIESILETELSLIPLMVGVDDDSAEIGGMDAAARIIAAEIDALTQTNALMLESAERGQATVAELRAQIDALTADNAQANQWLVNGVAKIERLEKERDEARAEVERLRPAEVDALSADAKAWRTLRRYERLLIAGFCSYADLNFAKAEAQRAAQEATT